MTTASAAVFGFSLERRFDAGLLAAVLAGTALIIGAACVVNNYIDRRIDARMRRTSWRASVTGVVGIRRGLVYAVLLGGLGTWLLAAFTNPLTLAVGLTGVFFYLVPYSIFKRRSHWGTVVGSVSGATPIVAGYTAVTGRLDVAALLLFLMMVCRPSGNSATT